ncbi:MAG: hypothetical protein JW776_15615 [Candidatus Lokiarchaeota archaeon]|nr:hypothetical protein [Candidatus Lokiarchaeota archaeon]
MNSLAETDNYPLVSIYKKPQWYPFTSLKTIPQVFLPHRDLLEHFFKEISDHVLSHDNLNLENLYWYLLLGKYLGVNLHKLPIKDEIYKLTTKCAVETEDQLGFQFLPFSDSSPDIWSTDFALVIFHLLGKLEDFLYQDFDLNRKSKVLNFLLSCKRNSHYVHCRSNCSVCKKTSEEKTLFHVLDILLLLGGDGIHSYRSVMLNSLKSLKLGNIPQNVFRLLDLRFLGSYEDVTDEQLQYFESFQKEDGGFSFSTKSSSSINETFWIVYLFDNYRFIYRDFHPGRVYSYLIAQIQSIDPIPDAKNPIKLMEFAKVTIMLTFVWENLVDELETQIFTWLDNPNIRFDMEKLTLQTGIQNSEYEILSYLNQKYKLTLKIVDNESRFVQFLNQLDPLDKYFAKFIFRRIDRYSSLNISEIVSHYNKNKPKSARVNEKILENLFNRMIQEDFFKGKFIIRKRLFRRTYLFNRDSSISKIITCNKRVNYESISAEKRKLSDLKDDIYNMHREIMQSSELIMREVESLIFAGEIEYAELRLKNNIKKALLDAEFFNQSIHQQLDEFEYINAPKAVSACLYDWMTLYDNLQSQYQKINLIMLEKIHESEKLRDQKHLIDQLETQIKTNISELELAFSVYQESFRYNLGKEYERNNVKQLEDELHSFNDRIKDFDHSVIEVSQQISVEDRKVKIRRKKVIEKWVEEKGIFDEYVAFYYEGFKIWHEKISYIDSQFDLFKNKIVQISQQISVSLQDKNYRTTKHLLNVEFSKLLHELEQKFKEFIRQIDEIIRSRKKLYLLITTLEKEWTQQKTQLEHLISKERENQQQIVELDKYEKSREDFVQLITEKITYLNSSFQGFVEQINEQLQNRKIPQYAAIDENYKFLQNLLLQNKKEIQQIGNANSKKFKDFLDKVESSLILWNSFIISFEKRLNDLQEDMLDEVVRSALVQYSNEKSTNQVDLIELSDLTGISGKSIRKRIESMISFSKISGELIKGSNYLIIHNDEWRKNQRFNLFISGELREIDAFTERIVQLYNNSIEHNSIDSSFEELNGVIENFYTHLTHSKESVKMKVKSLNLDIKNEMFVQNFTSFKSKLNDAKELVHDIHLRIASAMKSFKLVEQTVKFLQEFIASWNMNIEIHMEQNKSQPYEKNIHWIETEYQKIEDQISIIAKKFSGDMNTIWNKIPESQSIQKLLISHFEGKLGNLVTDQEERREDIVKRLFTYENQRVKKELDGKLFSHQDILNNHLGRIQFDIENRIEINEFKSAMQRLHTKLNKINDIIRHSDKSLKKQLKKITSKSKTKVNIQFVMQTWKKFVDEYRIVVKEKQLNLELLIIQKYVEKVIRAFKDEYIPLNYLSKEFRLKRDIIQERLITLIGENRLPGKLYLELMIYYENPEPIQKLDQSSVDMIKTSNVHTYLIINRIQRLAKQIYPILMVIGSLLTITLSALRIVQTAKLEWWVLPAALAVLLLFGFVYILLKRKDKKIVNDLDE